MSVYGNHKKNQQPSAGRSTGLGDGSVLEAWSVRGIKNKTELGVEALKYIDKGELVCKTRFDLTDTIYDVRDRIEANIDALRGKDLPDDLRHAVHHGKHGVHAVHGETGIILFPQTV